MVKKEPDNLTRAALESDLEGDECHVKLRGEKKRDNGSANSFWKLSKRPILFF
jgi:hypothetical protein